MSRSTRWLRLLILVQALAAGFATSSAAHAGYVSLHDSGKGRAHRGIWELPGSQGPGRGATEIDRIEIVHGADIGRGSIWLKPLRALDLLVTDFDGVRERLNGPGTLEIRVDEPTKLLAAVLARSAKGYGLSGFGSYQLRTSFTPVRLPAAAWLLVSGIGALFVFARRKRLR